MKNFLTTLVFFIFYIVNVNANQLSKSPFIPDNVYKEFNELPVEHKIKFCGFENFEFDTSLIKRVINRDLPLRILGYNSRMDNDKLVEGIYARDVFREYTKAITYSIVSEDVETKEFLFNKLYILRLLFPHH